jgi:hypothetical protein
LAILDYFTVRLYDTYFENIHQKLIIFFLTINGRNRTLQRFQRLFVSSVSNKSWQRWSWVMTESLISRVQAFEMQFLRRIAGLSRLDWVRNATIRELLNVEPLLLRIERSQLRCYGHILRMPVDRLPKRALFAQQSGRRPRGTPRTGWWQYILKLCNERLGLKGRDELFSVAEDCDHWRQLLNLLSRDPKGQADKGNE